MNDPDDCDGLPMDELRIAWTDIDQVRHWLTRLRSIDRGLVERARDLVRGVEMDLDEPLPPDDE